MHKDVTRTQGKVQPLCASPEISEIKVEYKMNGLTHAEDDRHLRLAVARLEQQRRDEGEGHRGRNLQSGHHKVDQNEMEFTHPIQGERMALSRHRCR